MWGVWVQLWYSERKERHSMLRINTVASWGTEAAHSVKDTGLTLSSRRPTPPRLSQSAAPWNCGVAFPAKETYSASQDICGCSVIGASLEGHLQLCRPGSGPLTGSDSYLSNNYWLMFWGCTEKWIMGSHDFYLSVVAWVYLSPLSTLFPHLWAFVSIWVSMTWFENCLCGF